MIAMNLKNIIVEIYRDDDGWWANLKEGWTVDGCTGVREDTKRKLVDRIKSDARQEPEA